MALTANWFHFRWETLVRDRVNFKFVICICFFRWCAKLTKSNCSYWILDKSQQSRTRGIFWYASRQPKGYWWIKYILNSILSSNLPLMLYWYSVFFRWKHILGSTVLFIYKCIFVNNVMYLFIYFPTGPVRSAIKGVIHPKMSQVTHPHVITNPYLFFLPKNTQKKIFWRMFSLSFFIRFKWLYFLVNFC